MNVQRAEAECKCLMIGSVVDEGRKAEQGKKEADCTIPFRYTQKSALFNLAYSLIRVLRTASQQRRVSSVDSSFSTEQGPT